jgi:hypothetical protein
MSMFRAIHKTESRNIYILGSQALPIDELIPLVQKELLVCEECNGVLGLELRKNSIWHFRHRQLVGLSTPYCRLRFMSIRKLLRLQIGTSPHLRAIKEVELIETDGFFAVSDVVREKIAAQSRPYFPIEEEPLQLPEYCHCEICGQRRSDWVVISFDTKVGKCRQCLAREHLKAQCRKA